VAQFNDMLDTLGVGDDGISVAYPETFLDDIRGAYDADMGIPTAKISVLEADLAAALAEIDRLKAHNYDLLVAGGAGVNDPEAVEDSQGDEDNSDDDDSDDEGTDSLFDNPKKDEDND
jgi:hypothetical protein